MRRILYPKSLHLCIYLVTFTVLLVDDITPSLMLETSQFSCLDLRLCLFFFQQKSIENQHNMENFKSYSIRKAEVLFSYIIASEKHFETKVGCLLFTKCC